MIPAIRSGMTFISSTLARASAANWSTAIGNRTLTQIRSFSDEQNCQSCGATIDVATKLFKDALTGPNTYSDVRTLAGKKCVAIKDDSFHSDITCLVSGILREENINLQPELQTNVLYYDKDTTEVIMSAFLKREDLRSGESDLTGDSGNLALEILDPNELTQFKGYVVDIGGQDSVFVKKFPAAEKRIVMDINAIAWALDKSPGVSYALGSADKIFRDSRFLSEKSRPETIFTMSNFINVLSPKFGWRMLEATISRMQPRDKLIITNLYRGNFLEDSQVNTAKSTPLTQTQEMPTAKSVKKNYYEDSEHLGIHSFSKKTTKEHYKSTLGDSFIPVLLDKFKGIELLSEKKSTLECRVRADRTAPVQFITIMFKKIGNV